MENSNSFFNVFISKPSYQEINMNGLEPIAKPDIVCSIPISVQNTYNTTNNFLSPYSFSTSPLSPNGWNLSPQVPDYLPIPAYGSSPTGDSTMAMCSGLGSQEDFCLEDHPSPHSPGLSSIAGSADCNSFCSYSSPYTFQHTSPSPSFSSDNINNDLVTPYDSTLVFAPWSDSWLSPDTPPALFSESHSSNTLASIEQLMDQHLVITSPLVQHQPLNEPQPSHTPAKDDSPVLTESIKKSGRTLHKCMFCSHTSNRANNMKEHVRTHDPLRPKNFSCPVCDKKFARKHDMKRHTKSHSRSNVRQPRRKATI